MFSEKGSYLLVKRQLPFCEEVVTFFVLTYTA